MDRFSIEELNLMCIYDTGTRSGLMAGLEKIALELAPEEAELAELIQSALKKLTAMSDQEYGELILVPDYKEEVD
ncbi:transposon-transfer assisting family protein [Papillibacter cinnamivorans]|uniref:Putative tranposon-transfer assisting protein n=1 Tax=Papillibacter cinnamivorans DSM 12816 TaxID=1122930 RepID=A0A1W2ALU8_9FIRM|nr:transposon-transfer assisting family protein [Papillibacter cinnamivorans]SMC61198.1 Putative tranposon-transfer assisting protein [Papillibacter cinnamivorans DSM 12816]